LLTLEFKETWVTDQDVDSLNKIIAVSMTKKCSERTTICKHLDGHCAESADRGIAKWFPGMHLKAVPKLAKVCHCPRELL
jgi:hypothetical protein